MFIVLPVLNTVRQYEEKKRECAERLNSGSLTWCSELIYDSQSEFTHLIFTLQQCRN